MASLGQPLADLWGCKQLLDVVEQVLGPEIAGHPVWNLRTKTPLNPLTTVPWHQDTAFMAAGAEHTFQPTAWIPFIDADSVNGTLRTLRGGHRSGKVFPHQQYKKTWYLYITDDDLPEGEVVTCEMPIGSLLLFNQLLPHCSTENFSDKIRWSVDLRWQRPDEFSGYEGIKDCILMRTARDPNYRADWSAGPNRTASPAAWTTNRPIPLTPRSPAPGSTVGRKIPPAQRPKVPSGGPVKQTTHGTESVLSFVGIPHHFASDLPHHSRVWLRGNRERPGVHQRS